MFRGRFIYLFLLIVFVSSVFTNCSLQKRVYRNGYHVVWNHKQSREIKKSPDLKKEELTENKKTIKEERTVTANTANEIDLPFVQKKPTLVLNNDTCGDILLLQNADELKVKVLEIDERTIKYKRCDNINGPTYSISKSKVAMITYVNGVKEMMMPESPGGTKEQEVRKPEVPAKTNVLGLTSLLLYIFGTILSRSIVLTNLSGSILVFILILSVLPLILAYVSLFQFKREPGKYKGRWMPVLVVCLYLAALLILALVLAALGSVYGSGVGAVVGFLLILFLLFLGILIAALIPKVSEKTNVK